MAAMLGYERYQTMEKHAKKLGIPLPRKSREPQDGASDRHGGVE
jgi:hypothetical protein